MKSFIIIAFSLFSFLGLSQEWRDSLKVARNLYKQKDYSKALAYYRSAQKNAPKELDFSDEIGQTAYKAKEFETAEKTFQQSGFSKKNQSDRSRTYHNLGNSRMMKKDYQGAIDAYKEALKNNSTDEETRYNLSEAIRRLKKEQQKKNNDQDKSSPENNSNDDKKQNDHSNQKNPQNNKDSQGEGNDASGELPRRSIERLLDQIMKAEAQTKRKMGHGQKGSGSTQSGKDW